MNQASSRQRVLKAFDRDLADRIPFDLGSRGSSIGLSAYEALKTLLGIESPTQVLDQRLGLAVIDNEVLERFGADTRYVYMQGAAGHDPKPRELADGDVFVDEWGATLKRPKGGYYYDHVGAPLAGACLKDLESYPWPDPDDPSRYAGLREEAKRYYDQGFAVGTYLKGTWEISWVMRGLQEAFMDVVGNRTFFLALMDRISDVLARMTANFFKEVGDYVQWICVTTDLGTQENLLVSPQTYKECIGPFEGRIYEAARKHSSARIAQHSCGAIFPIIPLLIDNGVEILNPIQTSAKGMDTAKLKQEYGRDICFWGGVDVQKVLTQGTPAQVRAEVERVLGDLGAGGGYLFGPSHDIQAMTPPENILAMYETALEKAAG